MPGIAGPGNLYVANVKWWVSVYSELANSSGTRVRISWRPLEGIKTSRSTLTGSTSVLQEKEPEEEMMFAYGDLQSKFNYCIIHVYNRGEAKISFLALSQFYT